jgi:hypothetical protein
LGGIPFTGVEIADLVNRLHRLTNDFFALEITMTADLDREKVWKDFNNAVNMAPTKLEKWLATEHSRHNGWKEHDDGETIGHHSGRRIVDIKHKRKSDLTDEDYQHMRKVVGYIHRHLKQGGPQDDKEHSHWRYSLMNWGHDPLQSNQL